MCLPKEAMSFHGNILQGGEMSLKMAALSEWGERDMTKVQRYVSSRECVLGLPGCIGSVASLNLAGPLLVLSDLPRYSFSFHLSKTHQLSSCCIYLVWSTGFRKINQAGCCQGLIFPILLQLNAVGWRRLERTGTRPVPT